MSPTPPDQRRNPTVLISSFLEPEYVELIREASPGPVLYDPDLVPQPRYRNDHTGTPPTLDPSQKRTWLKMLSNADVCFDFDWMAPQKLASTAPNLRWIQATSAGIGGFVSRNNLDTLPATMTTAAGVHAQPLAEFAAAGLLYFFRDMPWLRGQQRSHAWKRYESTGLAGQTIGIVGLGKVGMHVWQTCRALGATVIGVTRPGGAAPAFGRTPQTETTTEIDAVLPRCDALVLCCPLTPQTRNLISATRIRALKPHAIIVNVARGAVIDENAMTQALTSRHIKGAVLDVFTKEPLPRSSPLWDMDNVIISPHSASTVAKENQLLTELFIKNLYSYLRREPLENVYDSTRGY